MGSGKKKKNSMLDVNKVRIVDYINYGFLALFFGIYPIVTHNKYFDITKTRFSFFTVLACIFIAISVLGYIMESIFDDYYGSGNVFIKEKIGYKNPDFWMIMFTIANVYALFTAPNITDAFFGNTGRYMGGLIYIVIGIAFFLLSKRIKSEKLIIGVFCCSTLYAYIVAIFQHMDIDFMNYKKGISPKQFNIFMSSFGNINIFASFVVISLAFFVTLYIYGNKKILYGIFIVLGGMVIMIANSDSAYVGFCAVAMLLWFLAIKDEMILDFVQAIFLMMVGNFLVVVLNKFYIKSYDKRGGVAQAMDNLFLATAILIAIVIFYLVCNVIKKKYSDRIAQVDKKKIMIIMGVIIVIIGIVGLAICKKKDRAIVKFNYRWGTYRGYIWAKCVDLFRRAPIVNKLFGYGNETLEIYTKKYYYDEMVAVTKKVYDNAHNELLQYLVTLGLFGMISYIGLFVSSFMYMIKRCDKKPIVYVSLAVITGYFVQGLINLNQPITTPFYFIFMAIGIGSVRFGEWVKKND